MAQIKKDLIHGSVRKTLISFSFPIFLSALLQALYGSADAIIVGHFSDMGNIAGVTQGSQMMNIATQIISGFSTGGCILIGQYIGAKKEKDLDETVNTLFTFFIIAALILMIVMFCVNGFLAELLSLSAEGIKPFVSYLKICEVGLLFIFLYNCISAVLQAMGDSKHPLLFVGIACFVNIVLDFVFVAGFKMGATGAAIATVIAQLLSVILSVLFLRKQNFSFSFRFKSLKLSKQKVGLITKLGIPYAIQRGLVYSSFMAISGLANPYGLEAGSVAGIVAKINTFATIPFSAFNVGVSTICARCRGANDIPRAKKTLKTGLLICFITGSFLFVICQLFPKIVLGIFSNEEQLLEFGIPFLRGYSYEYILMPFTWAVHGFFAGFGYTIIPSIDGILASVVFRTPLALLFSQHTSMGFGGIAFGAAMAVWGAIIPAWIFYFSGIWKKEIIKIDYTKENNNGK